MESFFLTIAAWLLVGNAPGVILMALFIFLLASFEEVGSMQGWTWFWVAMLVGCYLVGTKVESNVFYIPSLSVFAWVMVAVGYLVLGMAWSVIRWTLAMIKINNEVAEACLTFQWDQNSVISEKEQLARHIYPICSTLKKFRECSTCIAEESFAPQVNNAGNHDKILNWMAFWPLSIIYYLSNAFVQDLFSWMADSLKGTFNSIAKNSVK